MCACIPGELAETVSASTSPAVRVSPHSQRKPYAYQYGLCPPPPLCECVCARALYFETAVQTYAHSQSPLSATVIYEIANNILSMRLHIERSYNYENDRPAWALRLCVCVCIRNCVSIRFPQEDLRMRFSAATTWR